MVAVPLEPWWCDRCTDHLPESPKGRRLSKPSKSTRPAATLHWDTYRQIDFVAPTDPTYHNSRRSQIASQQLHIHQMRWHRLCGSKRIGKLHVNLTPNPIIRAAHPTKTSRSFNSHAGLEKPGRFGALLVSHRVWHGYTRGSFSIH